MFYCNTKTEQDRQCMYVILWCASETIIAVEEQCYTTQVCICSVRYPARNAHAPYCHLWPTPDCNVFPHCFINGTIFEKKNEEYKMCVSILSTIFVCNVFYSTKKWATYDQKFIWLFVYSAPYSWQILMKLEFSRQIFKRKYSTIKFH